MTSPPSPRAHPSASRWALGCALLVAALLSGCARKGVSYPHLISLVAQNECPQARLGSTDMLVAFITPDGTRYVSYPGGETVVLDSSTLFQLGSLTTAYLVPSLLEDIARAGLTLDSVALTGGALIGEPWDITYADLLLHHTGLPIYDAAVGGEVVAQIEEKLTRIGRAPPPTEREFHFDHWHYTLARMSLAKRLPETRGDLRSDGLAYVDRADTSVRQRLAPSEAERPPSNAPKQATELFIASTGAMASAEQLVQLVNAAREVTLERLPAKPTTRTGTDVTLGWYKSPLRNGHSVYTNAGRTRRHGAAVAFYPYTQTGVVVLATDSKPVDCLALDLLRNVNDNWKREPSPHPHAPSLARP